MSEKKPGFGITDSKGFHVTFENGYTVSVQFGWGNYCDHYNRRLEQRTGDLADDYEGLNRKCGEEGSTTAETAVIDPEGSFVVRDGNEVQARQSPAQVLETLNWAASQ